MSVTLAEQSFQPGECITVQFCGGPRQLVLVRRLEFEDFMHMPNPNEWWAEDERGVQRPVEWHEDYGWVS